MTSPAWTEFLVCTKDYYSMSQEDNCLRCPGCGTTYEIRDGIPMLLPQYDDDLHRRYFESYRKIAQDDLAEPLEGNREVRVAELARFIGSTSGKNVLDVGAGSGLLLKELDANVKVALDISMPYLEAIRSDGQNLFRVCADAEKLPVAKGFFDVIIVSGVLEHLLSPESFVARLRQICDPDTRIIVLVPWEEDLTPYKKMQWEFTHLRTFNAYTFSRLWYHFRIVKKKGVWPRMSDPVLFRMDELLPGPVFDFLRYGYFHQGLAKKESEHRMRWYGELPKREGRLLRFYRPTFYQFELRTFTGSWIPTAYERAANLAGEVRRLFTRSR